MKQDKTGSEILIDVLHHKVHHGLLNFVCDAGTNVQIASPKYWEFKTPDTSKRIHFNFIGMKCEVFGLRPKNIDPFLLRRDTLAPQCLFSQSFSTNI